MESDAIRLYTVREAAAVLKVHERTVLRWVKSGRLAARRIGRQIRIDQDALRTCGEPVVTQDEARRTRRGPRRGAAGKPRRGSAEALLECAGMLTEAEAQMIRDAIREADRVDWEDWKNPFDISPG